MTTSLAARLSRFDRVGLLAGPTPLEPMTRLSAALGGPRLWVKREDLTGAGFGGNKLRKLDYLLTGALAAGADTLVSGGVVQSNSQRQVAVAAARLGLDCHLAVYHGRVAPLTAEYESSGNALLNRLFGATLHDVPWDGDRNGAIRALADRLQQAGKRPFMVPYGASSAMGAVGYTSAIDEIAQQCAALDIRPAAIVHCSGSAATQAGLTVGAALDLPDTQVVGIDIDAEPERVTADALTYATGAAELLDISFDTARIEVVAGLAGPAYGVPHAETVDAIRLAGQKEALVLDPVYSGKGLAGLISLIRAGRWHADQDVIFVHTGGAPALFAYGSGLTL